MVLVQATDGTILNVTHEGAEPEYNGSKDKKPFTGIGDHTEP
jgi:hypothetical protein